MTQELAGLLSALQFGDSFFPGGGVSLSWGLEALCADAALGPGELAAFVAAQLRLRWAPGEACALVAAWRAAPEPGELFVVDWHVEALTLPREWREGSRRAGAALLQVHGRLGTAGAVDYTRACAAGLACGHLPVVQGLLWRARGLSENSARALSAHGLVTGQVGAALRLGRIGHVQAQEVMLAVRPVLLELLAQAPPPLEEMAGAVPATEIAALRHETQATRLFAN